MLIAQRELGMLSLTRWAFVPLRDFYIAIAIVATISSGFAIAQAVFDYHPFQQWSEGQSPGIFFNPVHAGSVAAIVIMMLLVNRRPWLIPGVAPGLVLSHSRGAWAALAIGLLAHYTRRPLLLLALTLGLAFLYSHAPNSSDHQRLEIWRATWVHLTFWGNGLGSFQHLWMGNPVVHPEYAHNEYLQIVFEIGIWAIIPFSILALALSRSAATSWPTTVVFLFLACFTMPFYMPVVAMVGWIAVFTTLFPGVTK